MEAGSSEATCEFVHPPPHGEASRTNAQVLFRILRYFRDESNLICSCVLSLATHELFYLNAHILYSGCAAATPSANCSTMDLGAVLPLSLGPLASTVAFSLQS